MTDPNDEALFAELAPTYDIHRELGGGGMSRVFFATDRALGREVVVKTLPSDVFSHEAVERFKREIRTAARLQHPNIVPLLSAGETSNAVPYFTMPWVEGASLRERLVRGPVALSEAISILRDMARALAAAHAKGVVHRDIKPENVLLSSGAALITDFGVARALSAASDANTTTGFSTGTNIAIGTPAYMAPEQFAADPSVDRRADVYAWGLVAYELLTGKHPFEGATGTALLQAHMSKAPPLVTTVSPNVPRAITEIVRRSLEKDPALRPERTEELAEALDLRTSIHTAIPVVPDRRVAVISASIAVVVGVLVAFGLLRGRGVATSNDARMIAIAPFRVGGASPDVHYLREGLGDLMTPQLQGIPGVTSPTMRVMLEQWRRAGGSSDADLDSAAMLKVARAAGAAQVIMGEIVGTAKNVTINAKLVRISDAKELARGKVDGSADSAATLAAKLVVTLLAIRDGATLETVRTVVSANPEAITPFLVGERAYRKGRYEDAVRAYASAYEKDTSFALAALRINVTNGWIPAPTVKGDFLRRAWNFRDNLHGGDKALLLALTGADYPAPRDAKTLENDYWQAAERYNTPELWYNAADYLLHRLTLDGDTTAWHRALDGFRRAEALDSSFVPALEHQGSIYSAFGDSVHARAAWNRQRMLDSLGDFFLVTDAVNAATYGSAAEASASFKRYRTVLPTADNFPAQLLLSDFPLPINGARRLAMGDAFLATVSSASVGAQTDFNLVLGANSPYLNSGRLRSFRVGAGSDSLLTVNDLNVLSYLVWDGDSVAAAHSADELQRFAKTDRDTSSGVLHSSAYFALGLWALHTGDTAGVERSRRALLALKPPTGEPWQTRTAMIHEKLLGAHLLVARKDARAAAQLSELDSLLIHTTVSRNLVLDIGNLLVSHLWESSGNDARALAAAERYHAHMGGGAFASARLRAIARLSERLGQRQKAIDALELYVGLRAKADAPYRADLAQARATLARLQKTDSR